MQRHQVQVVVDDPCTHIGNVTQSLLQGQGQGYYNSSTTTHKEILVRHHTISHFYNDNNDNDNNNKSGKNKIVDSNCANIVQASNCLNNFVRSSSEKHRKCGNWQEVRTVSTMCISIH